ncbi:uncharacterized protein H6S33_009136 [Morchella sextelata]|uniref:uncharacterized protein n=1 Tax=Morchella sextelata TaxID=1174677 RepID=UPI001D0449B3|nr:uncharacterized protein H6S33_009136 [Morchella sextelata]KAH0612756.1 hypothetical protein H6S33_009136 [Morchella sextelata]
MKLSLLALVSAATLLTPTPASAAPQLQKRHGTDVSHLKYYQYPAALPNGHSLFAPILYHQVQASQPTRALSGAATGGGGHFNGDTTTYEVFDFPADEFAGRQCRFHFLLGPADMGRGYGSVWSVAEDDGWVDEETTWESRPREGELLAEFDVDPADVRYYRDGDVGAHFMEDTVFACPVGEKVWEVRAGEADKDDGRVGRYGNSANWSLNKGLVIERLSK